MGYILKKSTGGGGGGDATAANQQKQIDQLTDLTAYPSVLKNGNDVSIFSDNTPEGAFQDVGTRSVFKDGGDSVFKDYAGSPVFKDGNSDSVFKFPNGGFATGQSAIVKPILNNIVNPFTVISFTAASLTATAALLQNFLTNNNCIIVNISFSQSALSHDILLVYAT